MEVISFTGKSGTGKSYNAGKLARQEHIEALIDDGLLIYKGSIVAGSSAKKCESRAKAMRTCLFNYDDHREAVKAKLKELKPKKLMILGTSDRMTDIIANQLELPEISRRIYIEDITTEEDRAKASESRYGKGEHVIPAPMMEIQRDFAGYFMHPIRFIRNRRLEENDENEHIGERTVVRPQYSYFGKFNVKEQVIEDIIKIAASKYKGSIRVLNFYNNGNERNLGVVIDVKIRKVPGVANNCKKFQKEVHEVIHEMTAFQVDHVNVVIKEISIKNDPTESRKLARYLERKARKALRDRNEQNNDK